MFGCFSCEIRLERPKGKTLQCSRNAKVFFSREDVTGGSRMPPLYCIEIGKINKTSESAADDDDLVNVWRRRRSLANIIFGSQSFRE